MADASLKSYRDLRVWREAIAFAKKVYALTGVFPAHERFGLTAQMRRAAVSIPSNIAEGHARIGTKEYLHYLSIALGSAAELDTQIVISQELNYLAMTDSLELTQELDIIGKMLRRLYQALESPQVRDSAVQACDHETISMLVEIPQPWNPGHGVERLLPDPSPQIPDPDIDE